MTRKAIELSPFVLLFLGTLGLLLDEFVFHWSRPATLAFAAANAVGLLTLGLQRWLRTAKRAPRDPPD